MEAKIESSNGNVVKTYGKKKKTVTKHPRLLTLVPDFMENEITKSEFSDINVEDDYNLESSQPEGIENEIMYFEPLKPDRKSQISLSQSSADTSSSDSVTAKFSRKRKRARIPLQSLSKNK